MNRDRSRDRGSRPDRREHGRSGERGRHRDERLRDERPRDDRMRDERPRDDRRDDRSRDERRDDRPRDDRRDDRRRDDRFRDDRGREDERERNNDRSRDHGRFGSRDDHGRDHDEDRFPPPQQSTGPWDPKAEAEKDPNWARIYVTNLPTDVTVDELQEIFGGLGVIAKEKQKRGYKDQWPWKIKIYTNEDGTQKGDAVITYEDSNAARSAPSFFNGSDVRGNTITVELAGKPEPPVGGWMGGAGGRGGGRGFGGGGRGYGRGSADKYGGSSRYRPY